MGSHSVAEHACEAPRGRAFCATCGKVIDRDALRSISARPHEPGAKTTVDVHDTHKAVVTEHWNDRVDVNMKMDTIRVKGPNAVIE